MTLQGEDQPFVRNVMTLKSCSPIVGVDVISFDTERDVLLAWRVILMEVCTRKIFITFVVTIQCSSPCTVKNLKYIASWVVSWASSAYFQDFVREVDPDIIIGYNICKFDLPYLIEVAWILFVDVLLFVDCTCLTSYLLLLYIESFLCLSESWGLENSRVSNPWSDEE